MTLQEAVDLLTPENAREELAQFPNVYFPFRGIFRSETCPLAQFLQLKTGRGVAVAGAYCRTQNWDTEVELPLFLGQLVLEFDRTYATKE